MRYAAALLFLFLGTPVFAQDLLDHYYEFGGAVTEGRESTALMLAEKILPDVSTLSEKRQAIFYYKLAGLHENMKNNDQAIVFYEKTLKLEPDYYVPHMALGYLYVAKANQVVPKINAEKDKAVRDRYIRDYNSTMKKAIPYLEKAMACDPNEQVLASIKNCYDSLKDNKGFTGLDARLKSLEGNCVTLLKED